MSPTSIPSADDLSRDVQLREELIKSFFSLIKSARIHKSNNQLIVDAARNMVRAILALGEDNGYVDIQIIGRRIYVTEKKLMIRPETVILFDSFIDYLGRRGVRGLRFSTQIRDARGKDIVGFARMFDEADRQERPAPHIQDRIREGAYCWAALIHIAEERETSPAEARKARGLKSYFSVMGSIQEMALKLTSNQATGLSKARRALQNMVDLIMDDEPLFRALSTIRFYDDYTFSHSVNVAILSMCIGKRIMLSKKSLESLGLCGLLHDLGKIEVPKNILNKPGKLTEEEFEVMKRHSINSVRLIVKIQASRDRKTDILLAPFEHHLKYDLSGYPKTSSRKSVSLFGRILTISDVYDAITSPRVYRRTVLPPDRALGWMWEGVGKDFDPILLKVFINMLGVYPVGTLLVLTKKRAGIVTEPPGDAQGPPDPARPWVVLLKKNGDKSFAPAGRLNLAEKDPKTGAYPYDIVRSANAMDYGIQPMEFIVN